jgi:hypothetical protein
MSEINYSTALRCIGQELERRGQRTFAIKREGSHYVVSSAISQWSVPAQEIVRYTPSDIEIMDRCGETQRGNKISHEFMHPAQLLRVIGDYLDKYASTLIAIIYNDNAEATESPFRVEYITREGAHLIDDRPGAALFDECVLMFQKRSETAATTRRIDRG